MDTTERLHFHFSLLCVGEGNGNPLQCSCLENPRDGGAWWAAVCGVAQRQTQLKRLSSSSSSKHASIHAPRSLSRQKTSSWSLTLSLSSSLLLEEGRAWDTPFPRQSRPSGTGGLVTVCERGQVVRVGTGHSHLKTVASPSLLLCTQLYPALEEDPLIFAGCQRASHIVGYYNFIGAAEDETNAKILVILVRDSLSHLPATQGWMP